MRARSPIYSVLSFLFLFGCGGSATPDAVPSDSNILLTLRGLPTRAASMVVSAMLDGKAAATRDTYTPPPASGQFGVNLPPTVSGTLKITADTFDSDGCAQGSGDLSTSLPNPQLLSADLSISGKSPRQCGALAPCAANTICPDAVPITTQGVRGLWTLAPSDIWAVGDAGLLLHYDGTAWTPTAGITTKDLKGIWASGPSDVWAVGAAGTVLHYNGTWAVSTLTTGDLKGVWGSSPTEIWAGGEVNGASHAILRHYSSGTWSMVDTGLTATTINGVYTSAPDFIYACGLDISGGLLLRWNGTSWNKIISQSADELRAFWGSGRTSLVVVGDFGSLVRYDDPVGWVYVNNSTNLAHLYGVTGDDQKTVYAVGDGGTIYRMDAPYVPSGLKVYTSTAKYLRTVSFGKNGIGWIGGTSGFLGHLDERP